MGGGVAIYETRASANLGFRRCELLCQLGTWWPSLTYLSVDEGSREKVSCKTVLQNVPLLAAVECVSAFFKGRRRAW